MSSQQKLELPFDQGLRAGLLTYLRRFLLFGEIVMGNLVLFSLLYVIANWYGRIQGLLVSLICAEGMLVLSSAGTLRIAFKQPARRTIAEATRVSRGLFREFIGEAVLFVPVSASLAFLVLRPVIVQVTTGFVPVLGIDALLGLISYGFPYRLLKHLVIRQTIRILKEVAAVDGKSLQPSVESGDKVETGKIDSITGERPEEGDREKPDGAKPTLVTVAEKLGWLN